MIHLQLAPTKTTERLFMFVESMLISHSSNKEGKVAQPCCALFKGRWLVFSQSYRMLSIWLCPKLFWNDKCHFPTWINILFLLNYRLKNNLNPSLFSGKAVLIFFLPRAIVCFSCRWLDWTLAYGLQET